MGEIKNSCTLCHEPFTTESEKEVEVAEYQGGFYHRKCFLKVIPEEFIDFLLIVSPRSIGDSISHTPLIRELKRIYPKINLDVLTVFPEIFKHNPLVRNIIPWQEGANSNLFKRYHARSKPFDTSDPSFPLHMLIHSVDFVSYGMFRKILKPEHKHYDINYTYLDKENVIKRIGDEIKLGDKIILIHPHKAYWATRTWEPENWQWIVDNIKYWYPEYKIISIGGDRTSLLPESKMDNRVILNGVIDMYNQFSLLESLALMDLSDILVTMDTGVLHLAGASTIDIVCAFTTVNSLYRLPYREGVFGKDCFWVDTDCPFNVYNHKFITDRMTITDCPQGFSPIKCMPEKFDFFSKITSAVCNRARKALDANHIDKQ
jgi:ADP-heptose:LPS heptosyltransferase